MARQSQVGLKKRSRASATSARTVLSLQLLVSLTACGGFVDLDVTFFTEMNLDKELDAATIADIPPVGGSVEFVHRVDVDLTEDADPALTDNVDDVVLEEIAYRVPENNMTGDLRNVSMLIGPVGTLGPREPGVSTLGVVAHIPAGTVIDTTDLDTTARGEAALTEYLHEMQFTMFVKGYAQVDDPSSPPTGKCLIEVDARGTIHKY